MEIPKIQIVQLTTTIKANKYFFSIVCILLCLGTYPLYAFDKIKICLLINKGHHPVLDYFFYYSTWGGSGITYGILLGGLTLWCNISNKKLLIGAMSFCVMSVIVQFMKRVVFIDHLRPCALIPASEVFHVVDGIDLCREFSFPSGHSGTIFTAICFLELISNNKIILYSSMRLIIAIIIAYSRLYLCQHFYIDVYVGACIGIFAVLLVYTLLIDWQGPLWLNKSMHLNDKSKKNITRF